MDGRSLREYKDGSTTIKYYLNGMNIVFEDREGSVLYYIYNEDEVLGFVYDGATYYYHKNILGDVIGILDSNYQEIVTYSYDAYGNILSITDNSTNNIGEINPFRYRSYYYDVETNLYYLNSRYYNPETGRFLNADGEIGSNEDFISNNLFTYASNNFVNKIDITGDFALTIGGLALGGLAATIGLVAGYAILREATKVAVNNLVTSQPYKSPKTQTKPKKKEEKKDNDKTIIYRYNGTNVGNLVPSLNDVQTNTGLSFSTIPPTNGKPAFVTTIGAINSTGILKAVKDGKTHVSVTPVVGTISDWRMQGSSSIYTQALRIICEKWDRVIR